MTCTFKMRLLTPAIAVAAGAAGVAVVEILVLFVDNTFKQNYLNLLQINIRNRLTTNNQQPANDIYENIYEQIMN